ncbi:hypothetical protein DFH28DRAFT_927356 [Melampsora americana]|nr:hypothetical protein DFH28DRAFT_927356 [Melampsora americana]
MPTRKTKKELADKEEARKKDFARRRAHQAGPEGLSPDRGMTGTPYHHDRPGHHLEDAQLGKRQYHNTDMVHVNHSAEVGFQEFPIPSHIHPGQQAVQGSPITAVGHCHGNNPNVVHRDPIFGAQATGTRAPLAGSNPHIDVDLTASPSPAPQATQASDSPVVATTEYKPNRAKLAFHVFIANNLTDAQKRSGVPVTYSDHHTKPYFDIMVNIHGRSLLELKTDLFRACNAHRSGCGTLLRDADDEGQVTLKGFINHGEAFGKSLLPVINTELIWDKFKKMMIKKPNNEVGFRFDMINPKTQEQTTSKKLKFNQAMYHRLPDALAPSEQDEIEMSSIDIDAEVQAQLTTLMALYSDFSINGRECMGCLNIENPNQAMSISHLGFDIWAKDLVKKKKGVTIRKPPRGPEFKWVSLVPTSKSNNQIQSNSNSAIDTLSALLALNTKNNQAAVAAPEPQANSPAPGTPPPIEDYLKFSSIGPEDQKTRELLKKYNIVDFEMFLSEELSFAKMREFGFEFGPALRLHQKPQLYREELKKRNRLAPSS